MTPIPFVHANIVSCDGRRLAGFYVGVFGCRHIPPERDLKGKWREDLTGIEGAREGNIVEIQRWERLG